MSTLDIYKRLGEIITSVTEAQETLRRDKLMSLAATSTMSNEEANAISESSHRVYILSPASFAKVQLLFIKHAIELRVRGMARMYPLTFFQKGIDAEMDTMFPNDSKEITNGN